TVVFDLSGGDFLSNDAITYDGEDGNDQLIIQVGRGTSVRDNLVFQSTADGSATLKVSSIPQGSTTGGSTMQMSLTSIAHVTLDGGNPAPDSQSTLLIDELVTTDATTPPTDIPTNVPVTQSNFKAETVLTANPVSFLRAFNPGVSEHFFTISQAE